MGRFNFKGEDDFVEVKRKAEELYQTFGEVPCPYFKEKIAFNAKGIRHLKFKTDQQARPQTDQYARLKLVHLAPEVLKSSHTLQGVWEIRRFEMQKMNSRWERVMKNVTLYEFIAVLEGVRVKVIVKQVQGGEKHFFSIIPFWGIDTAKNKRILHSGDLERD